MHGKSVAHRRPTVGNPGCLELCTQELGALVREHVMENVVGVAVFARVDRLLPNLAAEIAKNGASIGEHAVNCDKGLLIAGKRVGAQEAAAGGRARRGRSGDLAPRDRGYASLALVDGQSDFTASAGVAVLLAQTPEKSAHLVGAADDQMR